MKAWNARSSVENVPLKKTKPSQFRDENVQKASAWILLGRKVLGEDNV